MIKRYDTIKVAVLFSKKLKLRTNLKTGEKK